MRRTLLLNYLYICALSILSQSPSCLPQTANSSTSVSDGQISSSEGRAVEVKQNDARLGDETNQRIQRGQLIDKQTGDNVRQVRRKRELRDTASSGRLRRSSNPSGRTGVASTPQRFKKSDHPMDQSLRKLVSKKNNAGINSAEEVNAPEDQQSQEKRDLHRQRGLVSRSSLSAEEDEAKSGRKEAKRSSYSSEAAKIAKPKSRAIKESDSVAQASIAKEKLKVQDSGRYAAIGDDSKAPKPESGNEQLEEEADLEENSPEYEEEGDDDDDREALARSPGHKRNSLEMSQAAADESEKLDQVQSYAEDDDSERQDIVKRDTGVAEEEYEDLEDQDEACEDANLVDESIKRQEKPGLLEKMENDDSRVKRRDVEASENVLEKNNGAPGVNEAAKASEHLQEAEEDPGDESKREISQTANRASSRSSLRPSGKYLKRQVALEDLAKDEAEEEVRRENEEANESSKRQARFQREGETVKSNESDTESKANVEDDSKGSKQESSLDATSKDDSNSDYEKKVEQQIQQKIESIKEEIKREVEEKQRIEEIEANNAKYDEIQSETEDDEDEDNQSLDVPSERKTVLKRSIIDGLRGPLVNTKRRVLRRVKRSETTDARQLRAVEGVEELDPDVMTKAKLRHESIRKRSAPIYGAADQDALNTSQPLVKRYAKPRRVYLVRNDRKRSPSTGEREARNTIIIPEQAHVNIEDELPPGLSLDPSLLEEPFSPAKFRPKRSPVRFSRRRRASAVIPEGSVAFLGYRPQDDDENDEGSEFDDDGFEDRTSNLQQDKSFAVAQGPVQGQFHADEDENPASFLFAGGDRDRDFLVRRKRSEIHDDQDTARLHGGGALARRQARARAKQVQTAKITSRKNVMERDKRESGNAVDVAKSYSVASLVGSSQELSPRLATEYKEAFGGLQSDPGGALARFKRVKREALRTGSLD